MGLNLPKTGKNFIKKNKINKKKLKISFIGFGKQAKEYAKVFRKLNLFIDEVFVRNVKNYSKISKDFNVGKVLNINEFKNKEKQILFIFLPWDKIQNFLLENLSNNGSYIYTEKPIGLSLKGLKKIINIESKKLDKISVLYNRRFYKTYDYLKNEFKKNELIYAYIFIPEKINYVLKNIDKNLKNYIGFHLTTHWLDFFLSSTKVKFTHYKKRNNHFFYSKEKNIKIEIEENGKSSIQGYFVFKNKILYFDTLEKLFIFENGKVSIIKESNSFKPGVKELVENIFNKKLGFRTFSPPSDFTQIYKMVSKLKH